MKDEKVWTARYGLVKLRSRKAVEREIAHCWRGAEKYKPVIFETEGGAVASVISEKLAEVAKAELALKKSRASLAKWQKRLAAVNTEVSQ